MADSRQPLDGGPFDQGPLIIGHRGAAGLEPENTLRSFRRAIELGVAAIELDVQVVGDRLVVFHDARLDRITNAQGRLRDQSTQSLAAVRVAGSEPIPHLEDVLDELPSSVGVNIELKGPHTARPVHQCLADYGHLNVLISSFRHTELIAYRHLDPHMALAPLFHRWPPAPWRIAQELDAWSINLGAKLATPKRIKRINQAGYRALVYTVNDPAVATDLIAWGVHGLFTDYPDQLLKIPALSD